MYLFFGSGAALREWAADSGTPQMDIVLATNPSAANVIMATRDPIVFVRTADDPGSNLECWRRMADLARGRNEHHGYYTEVLNR